MESACPPTYPKGLDLEFICRGNGFFFWLVVLILNLFVKGKD